MAGRRLILLGLLLCLCSGCRGERVTSYTLSCWDGTRTASYTSMPPARLCVGHGGIRDELTIVDHNGRK